jgi:ribokinase
VAASMERASKYAALSVTKKGTQDSYAETKEFEEFLKQH